MSKTKKKGNLTSLKIIKLIWKNINPSRRRQCFALFLIMIICGIAEISNLIFLKNFLSILNITDSINQKSLIIDISKLLSIENNYDNIFSFKCIHIYSKLYFYSINKVTKFVA